MQLRCAPAGISPTPDAISRQDVPFPLGITLLGYAAGLFGLVPLIDRLPLRPLIGSTLGVRILALVFAAWTRAAIGFLAASFVIGAALVHRVFLHGRHAA